MRITKISRNIIVILLLALFIIFFTTCEQILVKTYGLTSKSEDVRLLYESKIRVYSNTKNSKIIYEWWIRNPGTQWEKYSTIDYNKFKMLKHNWHIYNMTEESDDKKNINNNK